MNQFKVDLTNCDKEPIHQLGKIQSYGFLIAADENGKIHYASSNISDFLNIAESGIIGKYLHIFNNIIKSNNYETFQSFVEEVIAGKTRLDELSGAQFQIGKKNYYIVLSHHNNFFCFEFEPVLLKHNINDRAFEAVSAILNSKTVADVYNNAVAEIKSLIGYDRIMVYKFLPDGSGEVVAEAKDESLDSFLGQRYPESDIPKQARALYKKNHLRLIADVESQDVAVCGLDAEKPLDMTWCGLRAVSPTHILYLKNMGVGSSYSISIMVEDELWGLISCHNTKPKLIDYRLKQVSKLICRITASQISSFSREFHRLIASSFQQNALKLQGNVGKFNSISGALTGQETTILSLTNATGAALVYDKKITLLGKTPVLTDVEKIITWITKNTTGELFYTDNFLEKYPGAVHFQDTAAGILASILSHSEEEMIVWFKPEKIYKIQWAGKPEKIIADTADSKADQKILPRTSFKVWTEIVKHHSEKWLPEELDSAKSIIPIILEAVHKKAVQLIEFNKKLQVAYNELDTFTYTVSHDLRTPLTVIRTYAQFLLYSNAVTDEKNKTIVKNILNGADKIATMLQQLLELSKITRQELDTAAINMKDIIDTIIKEQLITEKYGHTQINIENTPNVDGSELLVYHVFSNIIGNALKYSSKMQTPIININGRRQENCTIYEITDNGIGMGLKKPEKAFELFKRLDNASEYEGTGVGLTIVKKIMEKHGGSVSFSSQPGKGTTFCLTFNHLL